MPPVNIADVAGWSHELLYPIMVGVGIVTILATMRGGWEIAKVLWRINNDMLPHFREPTADQASDPNWIDPSIPARQERMVVQVASVEQIARSAEIRADEVQATLEQHMRDELLALQAAAVREAEWNRKLDQVLANQRTT